MNWRAPDANSVPTIAERRRLLEVHRAATRFFRRELLRSTKGWAAEYLIRGGARALLTSESTWTVGYAPDSRSGLVDHLRARGFEMETVRNAGLGLLSPEGRMVDRFRDQVMFPSWNDHLEAVGYFGVRRGAEAYYVASPATQIHRRSNALLGVAEQHDLLSKGAAPVLVNDPLDAVAIERISRLSVGRWAGIPLATRSCRPSKRAFSVVMPPPTRQSSYSRTTKRASEQPSHSWTTCPASSCVSGRLSCPPGNRRAH